MPDDFTTIFEDRVPLIKPVTKREIFCTLKSMAPGKSPSLDGMNVDFFLYYWNIIGDSFFKAIPTFSVLLKCLSLGVELLLPSFPKIILRSWLPIFTPFLSVTSIIKSFQKFLQTI